MPLIIFFLLVITFYLRKSTIALNIPSAGYFYLLSIFPGSSQLADRFQPATRIVISAAEEDVEDSIATPSVVRRVFSLR